MGRSDNESSDMITLPESEKTVRVCGTVSDDEDVVTLEVAMTEILRAEL